jgi:hypothetical protein
LLFKSLQGFQSEAFPHEESSLSEFSCTLDYFEKRAQLPDCRQTIQTRSKTSFRRDGSYRFNLEATNDKISPTTITTTLISTVVTMFQFPLCSTAIPNSAQIITKP